MASRSNRAVWIAIGVFVLVAALIKLGGGPLLGWLKALHGPPGGGGH